MRLIRILNVIVFGVGIGLLLTGVAVVILTTSPWTRLAGRKIKGFSGGMKRRVGIAEALVNDPELLIVDEPTAGLDPEEPIRFRNLLVHLAADRVVLLSTHIVEDIAQTCRDIAVLGHGQVLFRGSPVELIQAAAGQAWTLTCSGLEKTDHGLTVVSMLHLAEETQYRLVGLGVGAYPWLSLSSGDWRAGMFG